MVRGALLLSLVSLVGTVRLANAQVEDPIVVEVSEEEPADATLVEAAARAAGGGLRGTELSREISERVLRPTRESDRSGLETLLETVREGIEDFYQNRFDQSVDKLTRARAGLGQAIDVVGRDDRSSTALFEAGLILAITLRHLEHADQARQVIQSVIRTFPGRRPMLAQFSPDLIRLYDEVRSGMDAAGMVDVRVTTDPTGCEVLRDGQSVGTSPWQAATYPGAHSFQVRCAGRLSGVRRTELQEGSHEIRFDPEAEGALHADPIPWVAQGAAARRAAAALARDLGRSQVVLVQRRRGRVVIQVVRTGSPRVVRSGEGPSAAVAWANLRSPDAAADESTSPAGTPWYRDVGAWAAVGIGAVSLVSGITLAGSARDDARKAAVAGTAQEAFDLEDSAIDTGTPAVLLTTTGTSLVLGGLAALVTPASERTTTFHGPAFWLLSTAGLVASGLGVGLLLLDGCEYDDHPLCPAVPDDGPFATNAPAGLILSAGGVLVLATSIVLRLTEEGGSADAP